MDYRKEYEFWLQSDCFNEETKAELRAITDEKEIEDRFYKNLKFGTGGMRGIIGAGTNRMNIYTITKVTQGLANYILEVGPKACEMGVVIAHDSRIMSPEFCEATALCLNANGIKTYVFDSLRPTPELSFAVRELGCIAGIVITASHNPPEYNGYKVYWEDGSQIVAPHDKNILAHVAAVPGFDAVRTISKEKAVADGLFNIVPASVDEHYYEELIKQTIHGEIIPEVADDITIVYTPLHGTGNVPVREVLKRLGFKKVYVVEPQTVPDGNFPTVKYPNPEEPSAFAMGIELAKQVDADVIMATDPDADRLGIYVKDTTGVWKDTSFGQDPAYPYVRFNANMTGSLMAEYVCREKLAMGTLPANGAICNTIVSSTLPEAIAAEYNLKYIETLTGFKYIGEQIKLFEENHTYKFVYGMEESFGCLVGDYTRDKDACGAVVILCEIAAFYKKQNKTLCDAMEEVYKKYGYYFEGAYGMTLKGVDGAAQIKAIMTQFRTSDMKEFAGLKVEAVRDYESGIRTSLISTEPDASADASCSGAGQSGTQAQTNMGLPKSNVMYYELENHAWFAARPSGNEPKIKFYFGVNEDSLHAAQDRITEMQDTVKDMLA